MLKINYDKIPLNGILNLISNSLEKNNYNKLLQVLNLRYKDNRDFNIYKVYNDNFNRFLNNKCFFMVLDNITIDISEKEFFNMDYFNDFLNCILKFQENKSHIDINNKFDLEAILKEIDSFDLSKISDGNIFNNINNLMAVLKNYLVDENNNLSSLIITDSVFDGKKIEYYLRNLEVFTEEDKKNIIDFTFRKKSHSLFIEYLNFEIFKFFDCNPEYGRKNHTFISTKILSFITSNRFLFAKYKEDIFRYFDSNNLYELLEHIGDWYLGFNGTTENGRDCYIRNLIYGINKIDFFDDFSEDKESNIIYYNLLVDDFRNILDILKKYKGKNVSDLNKKIFIRSDYIVNRSLELDYKDNKYYEKFYTSDITKESIYFILFQTLDNFNNKLYLFEDFLDYKDNGNVKYLTDEVKILSIELFDIIDSLKLEINDFYKIENIGEFLNYYFYNNFIEADFAWQIINDKELFRLFEDNVKHDFYGIFEDNYDFIYFLLLRCLEKFDFQNVEHMKKLFSFDLLYCDKPFSFKGENYGNLYLKIQSKIKDFYEDYYNIIKEFIKDDVEAQFEFLKSCFE